MTESSIIDFLVVVDHCMGAISMKNIHKTCVLTSTCMKGAMAEQVQL